MTWPRRIRERRLGEPGSVVDGLFTPIPRGGAERTPASQEEHA